jgi:Glutathione S-transferase, N-terminal domain
MQLVGQYDSPYVRRVAISLTLLGLPFTRNTISVFADADEMRRINPVVRIPSLILDDGEVLIDSAAILDHVDETVGPERALLPPRGAERRPALRIVALATSACCGRPRSATRPGPSGARISWPVPLARWRHCRGHPGCRARGCCSPTSRSRSCSDISGCVCRMPCLPAAIQAWSVSRRLARPCRPSPPRAPAQARPCRLASMQQSQAPPRAAGPRTRSNRFRLPAGCPSPTRVP